jgi:hypothetical protein
MGMQPQNLALDAVAYTPSSGWCHCLRHEIALAIRQTDCIDSYFVLK